jgi:hypothetical protein
LIYYMSGCVFPDCDQPPLYTNSAGKQTCADHVCMRCVRAYRPQAPNPAMPSGRYCAPCSKVRAHEFEVAAKALTVVQSLPQCVFAGCDAPALYSGDKPCCAAHACRLCVADQKTAPRLARSADDGLCESCAQVLQLSSESQSQHEQQQLSAEQARRFLDEACARITQSVRASIARHRETTPGQVFEAPVRVDLSEPFSLAGMAFLTAVGVVVKRALHDEGYVLAASFVQSRESLVYEGQVAWYPLDDEAFAWETLAPAAAEEDARPTKRARRSSLNHI